MSNAVQLEIEQEIFNSVLVQNGCSGNLMGVESGWHHLVGHRRW